MSHSEATSTFSESGELPAISTSHSPLRSTCRMLSWVDRGRQWLPLEVHSVHLSSIGTSQRLSVAAKRQPGASRQEGSPAISVTLESRRPSPHGRSPGPPSPPRSDVEGDFVIIGVCIIGGWILFPYSLLKDLEFSVGFRARLFFVHFPR